MPSKLRRSTKSKPCPICNGDGCAVAENIVCCWRVQSGKQSKLGSWIHDNPNTPTTSQPVAPDKPIASIDRRNLIYSAMLDFLPLRGNHADHLMDTRRLSDVTITRCKFASVVERSEERELIKYLRQQKSFDLDGVPGFFQAWGKWNIRFANIEGFYIPIRNPQGQIEALQIRLDHPTDHKYLMLSGAPKNIEGFSSGAPTHYEGLTTQTETAVIVEGRLKAQVVNELTGKAVIGLVSASTFSDFFASNIRRSFPCLKQIEIAFDADWQTNDKIKTNLQRLAKQFSDVNLKPVILSWDMAEGKGYDDVLIKEFSCP